MSDLLQRPPASILPYVPRNTFQHLKIVLSGDQGVGKSCLIKRYCEGRFTGKYVSTIGVDYGVKQISLRVKDQPNTKDNVAVKVVTDSMDCKVHFWDLAGNPCFLDVRNEFYKLSQGMILVFSVTVRQSFEGLGKWQQEAIKFSSEEGDRSKGGGVFVVVCGNKIDTGKRVVTEEEGRHWAESKGFLYFETSASSGEGVTDMFETLFRHVIQKVKSNG